MSLQVEGSAENVTLDLTLYSQRRRRGYQTDGDGDSGQRCSRGTEGAKAAECCMDGGQRRCVLLGDHTCHIIFSSGGSYFPKELWGST